jgi:hypothetical protein
MRNDCLWNTILSKFENFFDKFRLPSENALMCKLILDLFDTEDKEFPLEQLQWWIYSLSL